MCVKRLILLGLHRFTITRPKLKMHRNWLLATLQLGAPPRSQAETAAPRVAAPKRPVLPSAENYRICI